MTELEIKLLVLLGELVGKIVSAVMSAQDLNAERRAEALAALKTQLDALAERVAGVKV